MKNLSSIDGINLLKESKDNIILDVRTSKEYNRGHIENSINIPIYELKDRIKELEEYKESNIFVHCMRGRRSPVAIMILEDNGFENLYHLYQGLAGLQEELEAESKRKENLRVVTIAVTSHIQSYA